MAYASFKENTFCKNLDAGYRFQFCQPDTKKVVSPDVAFLSHVVVNEILKMWEI